MKTLYDRMPSGLDTEDRARVNRKANTALFSNRERGMLEELWLKNRKWFRYRLFKDWLHDQFVLKYYLGKDNALDHISWNGKKGKIELMYLLAKEYGWAPEDE